MNGKKYAVVNLGDTFTPDELKSLVDQDIPLYLTPSDGFIRWIKDAVPINPDCVSETWTQIGWLANMIEGWTPTNTHP